MKKLLLMASAALLAASSASAATWAVVGAYTDPNWNFEASTVLEGDGDVLSCTIANLIGDFKIVDIDDSSWAIQYGTATPIELDQEYTLDGKDGGPDPSNIHFAGNILSVKDAVVYWNPSTFQLKITGEAVMGYPTLYVTGSFCSWNTPGEGASVLCTEKDGVYTAEVDLGDSGNVEFKLAGQGWSNEVAGPEDGVIVGYEPVTVSKGGKNLVTELTGVQTLVYDSNEMEMWFVDDAGVDSIGVDLNAPAVYYNLNGVRVNNPEKGVYLVKQGKKTAKVVIK